ncbi:hypothetical protein SLEP1_g14919 [Rubroshorea leprosula]|uniref:Secreted protein n=1 Tax=Rubroshorea leprosula TaxID=152421 RepID=A0AAV5IQ28_9ROSI|nr:hypothetical protein SLEP1_g14919 [Rubroshorea leprosula]
MQLISVSGHLVILAASTHDFFPALSCPLVFNPIPRSWTFGPPLATRGRWCATGASRTVADVASGIVSHFSPMSPGHWRNGTRNYSPIRFAMTIITSNGSGRR